MTEFTSTVDIHQSHNLRIISSLANDHAGPRVPDENYGTILQRGRTLRRRNVVGQRR
jgi:hypothetical protein